MTKERLNMSTENNENNNRQEPKRVRQLLLMLILSWIALISVTVQYVRYRQQVVQQTEGRLSGEDPELTALQSDYQNAMERAETAEQLEADRLSAMDAVAGFINAFFINSDSKEQLLSACEQYIEEDSDAWQVIEVLAENQSYSDGTSIDDRELYYYEGDCTTLEDDDGNVSFTAFAIFTIRQIIDGETRDQSYMLSAIIESNETGSMVITEINTLTKIYFQAD